MSLIALAFFLFLAEPLAAETLAIPEGLHAAYPEAPRRDIEVTWLGSQYIIQRDYQASQKLLEAFQIESPQSLVPSLGLMFLHHTRMLENFDFRFENEFAAAEKINMEIINKYYSRETGNRWENLLVGGSLGLRGMMKARRQHWLKSAALGWEAVAFMKKSSATVAGLPDLYDSYYGRGMYHYWISWAQRKSLILTVFPDRRQQGLDELQICADKAIISGPMAAFALAYLYALEGKLSRAFSYLNPLFEKTPQSILIRSLMGRLLIANRQPEKGIAILESILQEEPSYTYIGFHLAQALYATKREPERVRLLLEAFVQEKNTLRPRVYLSQTSFYLAEIYAGKQDMAKAKVFLKKVKKQDLPPAEQKRLGQLKKGIT